CSMNSQGSISGSSEHKPSQLQQVQQLQQHQFGVAQQQPQLQYYPGGFVPGAGFGAGANPIYGAGWAPPQHFPGFGGPGMAPYFGGFYGSGQAPPARQIDGPFPPTVFPLPVAVATVPSTGSAPTVGYCCPEKVEHDRDRLKLESLKAAIEKKMRETMMKALEEKAKMNLRESESQKKIDKLERCIERLERDLEAVRASKERVEHAPVTQPAPEKKDGTTQTVDPGKDKQNQVSVAIEAENEDDEAGYGTPVDTVDEEAGEAQIERESLGRSLAAKR
ncbi:hypothetical protein PFISCL1PPCAC_22012, partial [Pristionchus fissidentatus]